MKIFVLLMLLLSVTLPLQAQQKPSPILQSRAAEIVGLINAPQELDKTFAPSFLAAVSPQKWAEISASLTTTYGKALAVTKITPQSNTSGQFQIRFEKDSIATLQISLENTPPNLVGGLLFTGVEKINDSYDDIIGELKQLPGRTSFTVVRLNDAGFSPLAAYNAAEQFAIGSAFKLYVLAELVRSIEAGEHRWDEVVPLRARSLPSGQLQNWPLNTPLTLQSLAALMISNSDNTATDQLIDTLGRTKIEQMLSITGNAAPQRSIPLLKTIELFKLKGAIKQGYAAQYLSKDEAAKRAMLAGPIAQMTEADIDLNFLAKPSFVSQLEWFASPDDLARAMNWIRLHSQTPKTNAALGVLGINTALSKGQENGWKYIGYKGGSEIGVINLTYLLQSQKGEWFVVSGSWNDESSAVNDANFIFLMQRIVDIVQKQSN